MWPVHDLKLRARKAKRNSSWATQAHGGLWPPIDTCTCSSPAIAGRSASASTEMGLRYLRPPAAGSDTTKFLCVWDILVGTPKNQRPRGPIFPPAAITSHQRSEGSLAARYDTARPWRRRRKRFLLDRSWGRCQVSKRNLRAAPSFIPPCCSVNSLGASPADLVSWRDRPARMDSTALPSRPAKSSSSPANGTTA